MLTRTTINNNNLKLNKNEIIVNKKIKNKRKVKQ